MKSAWTRSAICLLLAGCGGGPRAGPHPEPCEPGCIDLDLDGFGTGCDCSEVDCDDYNPDHWDDCGENCEVFLTGCPCDAASSESGTCFEGAEGSKPRAPCQPGVRWCQDGLWSPCAGQILPEAEVCDEEDNDCDGMLNDGVVGPFRIGGADAPFDCAPGQDEHLVCEGGVLTVEERSKPTSEYIWIPSRGDYSTGSAAHVSKVNAETYEVEGRYLIGDRATYISGVSVNLEGALAITASYPVPRLTRIDAYDCPAGETSTGPDDVRDWGDDACVAWSITAIKFFSPSNVAWELRRIVDGVEDFIWFVDGWGTSKVVEVTGDGQGTDRAVLVAPATPRAIAFDADMNLWVADARSSATLTEIDTVEAEVIRTVEMPSWMDECMSVDAANNVWMGGGGGGGYVLDQGTEEVYSVDLPYGVGLAVGGDQYRWFGGAHGSIYRVDASDGLDNLTVDEFVLFGVDSAVYVGVDRTDQVWAVLAAEAGLAHVFPPSDPDSAEMALDSVGYPGACGDMTGSQLEHVADPALLETWASYRWRIEGCGDGTFWSSLAFEVETPGDSSVEFLVGTNAAPLVTVCTAPNDPSPCSIADALAAAGVTPGWSLEVTILLKPFGGDEPVVREVRVE